MTSRSHAYLLPYVRCRLIIYYLIYVRLTLTLAKVCPPVQAITIGIFPSFNLLYKELSPGFHLVDNFQNSFSFNTVDWKINNAKFVYLQKLSKVFEDSLQNFNTVLILSDVSIKNQVAMSITHIHYSHNIIAKTIYHAMNITTTEAELFTIRIVKSIKLFMSQKFLIS